MNKKRRGRKNVRNVKIKEADFKYTPSSTTELIAFMTFIADLLVDFAAVTGIAMSSINNYGFLLMEINSRLDQQIDYYQYFYSEETITDLSKKTRDMALLCYWIIKYKPFYLEKSEAELYWDKYNCTINERFALHIVESYVQKSFIFLDKKDIHFFTPENRRKILFNFTNRDISKESLILFIGSLISQVEI